MSAALVALVVALLALGPLIPLLRRLQVFDVPNDRSSHAVITPRGGGLGALLGLVAGAGWGAATAGDPVPAYITAVLAVVLLLAAVGLTDDIRSLTANVRLLAQVLAGVAGAFLVLAGTRSGDLLMLGVPFAALWIVGFVNAFNFMDGINGIAGVTGAVTGAWYAWIGTATGDVALVVLGAALAGACLGFLPWNLIRPKVFLGDVGSYGLGCLIAVLALWIVVEHGRPIAAAAPLALYIADTSLTLLRRWRAGASLATAHREHAYQRVTQRGWGHAPTSLTVGVLTLGCCLLAMLPAMAAVVGIAAVAVVYVTAPRWIPAPRVEMV